MNKVKFKFVILVDFLRTTKELSMNSTGLTKVCERIFLVIQCILMKDKKKYEILRHVNVTFIHIS